MDAIVAGYHGTLPRYALIQMDREYAVVDVEIGELQIGDQVSGDFTQHGPTSLTNHTSGQQVRVCVEAIHANAQSAVDLLQT